MNNSGLAKAARSCELLGVVGLGGARCSLVVTISSFGRNAIATSLRLINLTYGLP